MFVWILSIILHTSVFLNIYSVLLTIRKYLRLFIFTLSFYQKQESNSEFLKRPFRGWRHSYKGLRSFSLLGLTLVPFPELWSSSATRSDSQGQAGKRRPIETAKCLLLKGNMLYWGDPFFSCYLSEGKHFCISSSVYKKYFKRITEKPAEGVHPCLLSCLKKYAESFYFWPKVAKNKSDNFPNVFSELLLNRISQKIKILCLKLIMIFHSYSNLRYVEKVWVVKNCPQNRMGTITVGIFFFKRKGQ